MNSTHERQKQLSGTAKISSQSIAKTVARPSKMNIEFCDPQIHAHVVIQGEQNWIKVEVYGRYASARPRKTHKTVRSANKKASSTSMKTLE